jgi:beta-lactamase superfamily II metal-dependent hydrolase
MAAPLPSARLQRADFTASLAPSTWVCFLGNVGDGDSQLILLPEDANGQRAAIVVDAFTPKVTKLVTHLTNENILPGADDIPLVVVSHPHRDHMSNMPQLFRDHGNRIGEFWDPGYYHPIPSYTALMREIEARGAALTYAQPTAGLRRWIHGVLITVLSPAVGLRSRFDTYGTEINDSSISLRIEYPVTSRQERDNQGRLTTQSDPSSSLILGADAQTLSWSYVMVDFPYLPASNTEAAKAIAAATGDADLLNADVFKVSHHGSKRGINLELIERISASMILVSSREPGGGSHNFPHAIAQEILREVKEPQATQPLPQPRKDDWEHQIFYTWDTDDTQAELGSIAVAFDGARRTVWRFDDPRGSDIDIQQARRWQ